MDLRWDAEKTEKRAAEEQSSGKAKLPKVLHRIKKLGIVMVSVLRQKNLVVRMRFHAL
jgi:hypothetical protein